MFKTKANLFALLTILILTMSACSSATVSEPATKPQTETSDGISEEAAAPETVAEGEASSTASVSETPRTSLLSYPVMDTGQGFCYNANGENVDCPTEGEALYGQDAQFTGNAFNFTDNGDGTVTDNVTGLLWQQTPDTGNYSWNEAQTYCESLSLGGSDTWRMPNLKELFSISNFSAGWPYLDLTYFDLTTTDTISKDEQYWTSNYYVGKTAEGQYDAAFGVNHATGHIKAYPALVTGRMGKRIRCVSGAEYGINQFVDNGDGTISDEATGLMWMQADSGEGMDWETALAYAQAQNEANYLGYNDWRLPNVKELQSIVNYNYAPDAQDAAYDGPALDPLFSVSEITNEAGVADYPYYWSSTSARFQSGGDFYYAWYVAAGRAVDGQGNDSHGAGAVRFDTKYEGGAAGEGGERYYNYVRLVRGGDVIETPTGDPNANDVGPELEFLGGDGAGAPQGAADGQPGGEVQQGGQPGGQPDFAAAAATLGITEEELMAALGDDGQGPPDFAAAADILGITEESLMEALGISAGGPPNGGGGQPPSGGQPQNNGG